MAFGVKQREKENVKKSTRYFSSRQELSVAEATQGRQTPNSGAASIKGDVLVNSGSYESGWLIECKTKTSNSESISIKRDWFQKNKYEASEMGKAHTALVFNFGPDAPYNENHYIIDEYLFQYLLDKINKEIAADESQSSFR